MTVDRYRVNDTLTQLAAGFSVELDDDTLNELTHHVANVLDKHSAADLEVVIANPDDAPEDQYRALKCPLCGAAGDTVYEVDVNERWNEAEPQIEGDDLLLPYGRGDSANYQHDHYRCGSCHGIVALPSTLSKHEEWS